MGYIILFASQTADMLLVLLNLQVSYHAPLTRLYSGDETVLRMLVHSLARPYRQLTKALALALLVMALVLDLAFLVLALAWP